MTPLPIKTEEDIYEPKTAAPSAAPAEEYKFEKKPFFSAVKRFSDILLSAAGLIISALPMAVVAVCIKADSAGPVIFKQQRVGRNGKLFTMYKFRSMYVSAPRDCATYELEDAQRQITRVGAFIRKTSLDELPQLINVLRGDMSIVGPRPLIKQEKLIHTLRMNSGVYRLRPGITGWAQINGRDTVSISRKAEMDAYYVRNRGFALDCRILFRTFFKVIKHDGIKEGK